MYITGRADTWLRNSGVLEENLNWEQFCKVLLQRFTEDSGYEAVEEFNNIKQGSATVSEYTDKFEDKMANYKKENPEVKEGYYIKCYINGLRGEIKHHVKTLSPTSLYAAIDKARDMERAANATALHNKKMQSNNSYRRSSYAAHPSQKSQTHADQPPAKRENEKGAPKQEVKFNEPRQCKYCGQKWFFGHRCQQYKRLNLMATEGNDSSEEEHTT
jgi:DNA-directed RNA polymerase subunit RPC12/RpoP